MNLWLVAAAVLLIALVPCLIVCFRGSPFCRLVGLEMTSVVVTLELVLLCEAFARPSFYDLPLTLELLSLGSGLVFTRFLQRWL